MITQIWGAARSEICDVKVSADLVSKLDLNSAETLCADKGYDSESLREQIKKTKTHVNIPVMVHHFLKKLLAD